ncbi:MAG: hypothetical protein QME68_07965 [Elusimicrobiota bacterium]|nr:hypothetical protein [Elusimicrobiota bacterium]
MGVTYDKTTGKILFIFSKSGGMGIEEIAKFHPESIVKYEVDILDGLQKDKIAKSLVDVPEEIAEVAEKIYSIFVNYDTEIVEINPLVLTAECKLVACDARMSIYDDAIPKQKQLHPNLFDRVDEALTDLEIEARKYGLGYIEMDGEIGVIGNGAGLNLATLDMLKYSGLNPSNSLEVSGRTYTKADKALEIILKKSSVKVIFGNFFGCISRCDVIARGLVDASKGVLPEHIPMIVAMRGNGADEGVRILKEYSPRNIEIYDDDEVAIERIKEILL